MAYVIRRARREFNKTVEEMEATSNDAFDAETVTDETTKGNGAYQNGTVTRHIPKVDFVEETTAHKEVSGS